MNKKIWIGTLIVVAVAILAAAYYLNKSFDTNEPAANIPGRDLLIGFSLGTLQEERWQRDRDEFLERAAELGVVVDVQSADNDAAKQIRQIEGMIVKGVDVLVVVPHDAESLTEVVDRAHAAGIKVLSYDRLIKNADVDLYLSFDNVKVGEYEARSVMDALSARLGGDSPIRLAYIGGGPTDNNAFLVKNGSFKVLQPYIDDKSIEVVLDVFNDNWSPESAYANLKGYLESSGGGVDAVVAANDGTAFGSIRALEEFGLAGKVPVSGQDAELSALQRIVNGTQTATVYKPISKLAQEGINLAIALAEGVPVEASDYTNNGLADIPSVLLESVLVTKDNIDQTVVADGYYSREEIYRK